ncbi:MAG: pyridoxal phosphate-dependent aminotransferase [Candidatus Micrarchaeia archaeon]
MNSHPNRLNGAVFRMGDYTLRRTDVNDAADRARQHVLDARLGDPTVFGLAPYARFTGLVEDALRAPKAWSYTDARGHPELREALSRGNPESGNQGYRIHPDDIFVGAGISGITRSLFSTLITKGDEVVIPTWSYIIYFAEAALSRARVVNAPLARNGEPDLDALESVITRRTKALFITTVGNPLGIAMGKETFCEILSLINRKEREYNHPIYLVADTIYESFRSGSYRIDPMELAASEGRIGPTVELYSISKMIGAPAARLGWMRVHRGTAFDEEVSSWIESLAKICQPTLGPVATPFQLALSRMFNELSDPQRREEYDSFMNGRRIEVIGRVRRLMRALSGIDGLVFPEYFLGADGRPDPMTVNSFYIVCGIDKKLRPRGGFSQAREMADHQISKGRIPVVLATPADSFLSSELRGAPQEYLRIVALSQDTDAFAEAIGSYARSMR